MEPRKYDVAIIGAGVIGLFIAHELSKFSLSIIVIEREAEPGFGVSKAHAGVIHIVQPPFNSLKSMLAVKGNRLYDRVVKELGVTLIRLPALLVARSITQLALLPLIHILLKLIYMPRGFKITITSGKRLRNLEPNIEGYAAIMIQGYGVIDSFELIYKLYRASKARGVEYMFRTEAKNIRIDGDDVVVETSRGSIRTRYVINAAGLGSDALASRTGAQEKIKPFPGTMLVFNKTQVRSIVAPLPTLKPSRTKGGGVVPTPWGTTIWGPSFAPSESRESRGVGAGDVVELIKKFKGLVRVKGVPIKAYAGVRPSTPKGDFSISYSPHNKRIINLVGIESPGLTAAPAIALIVIHMLKTAGLRLIAAGKKPQEIRWRTSTRARLAINPQDVVGNYGEIICPCMKVSLGDIVDAIEDGASTLDGVIFRTKLGMGTCQGQHCLGRAITIILKTTGQDPENLVKNSEGSWLVKKL